MSSFGFMVEKYDDPDDGERWTVKLPHQCDSWEITEEYSGSPHDEAVDRLEAFINEAREAMAALTAKREYRRD
jgi:hypothetical protein